MAKTTNYIPDAGDVVWINFDPQAGREMAKCRPALVMSPYAYNRITELCIVCPITSQVKGYPYEVPIKVKGKAGAILADHLKSQDWKRKRITLIAKAPAIAFAETREKIAGLLFDDVL